MVDDFAKAIPAADLAEVVVNCMSGEEGGEGETDQEASGDVGF